MDRKLFLLIFISFFIVAESFVLPDPCQVVNNRPIIGILTQEVSYKLNEAYPDQYSSYIASSYVKFVEGAGGRVVPIWIGKDDSYYEDIMSKVNGVLLPGGSSNFNTLRGYSDAGEKIYEIAKRLNRNGDYFPILGICLGFELLTYLAANRQEHRTDCSSNNQPLPLEFTPDSKNSKLFQNAPQDVIKILQNENVTANYHHFCVTKKDLKRVNLVDEFRVMSLNHDQDGLEFISSIEHTIYPFYGVQFHPEKNIYEWVKGRKIPHGKSCTKVSQFFADFFLDEARKSLHKFESETEELESLIYNYPATYTGLKKSAFVQCYMFEKNV